MTAGLGDHHTSHLNDSSARLPDNNIEVTVFRICLRERVDIRVTPLSVPILTHLQGDIERIVRSRFALFTIILTANTAVFA